MTEDQISTHAELFDLTGKRALGHRRHPGNRHDDRARAAAGGRPRGDQLTQGRRVRKRRGAAVGVRGRESDSSRPLQHDECRRLADLVTADGWAPRHPRQQCGRDMGRAAGESFPDSAWDKVLDLNLKSPFWLVQALLPALRGRPGPPTIPARIVNIGSIDGIRVSQLPVYSYASSKAALHQLTRVLARELGTATHHRQCRGAGTVPSKMMAATLDAFGEPIAASAPLRRIGRDDDMAGIAVFLASRAGSYLTGAVIPVDGGIATTASGTSG